MNFIQFILLVLLSLEPSYGDRETWDVRTERMGIIAKAIDDASSRATCSDAYANATCEKKWTGSKKELAMLLVTKGFYESRFAKNVHEGKCAKHECDAVVVNGKVIHLARSPWQIQRTPTLVSEAEYKLMSSASLEGTTTSANVATRYLSMGFKTCHTIQGAIAMYGGAGCTWEGAVGRYGLFNKLMAKKEKDFQQDADKQKIILEKRLANQEKK
jgi:hypothetical protein